MEGVWWEYEWPLDCPVRNLYVPMQEAVRFLSDKRLAASNPGLQVKSMSEDEATFLKNLGLVLTSKFCIPLDSLLSVMEDRYPAKHEVYMSKLHDKALDFCGMGAKTPMVMMMETAAMRKIVESKRTTAHRALRKAARYNSELAHQRRAERSAYYDTQTQIVHYPEAKRPCHRQQPVVGDFPVAVLPGQYQDYCPRYTPEQLQCLPLKTMTALPPAPPAESVIPPSYPSVTGGTPVRPITRTLSRDAPHSTPCPATSASHAPSLPTPSSRPTQPHAVLQSPRRKPSLSDFEPRPSTIKHDKICGLCLRGPERNRKGEAEALIQCSTCQNSGHPSCLELSTQTVRVLRSYPWQCMECKNCMLCSDPGDEDKMMFCDDCDRGYHTFCVGLTDIPTGQWMCKLCSSCACCGKHERNFDYGNLSSHHFTTPRDGSEPKYVQTLCEACSRLFTEGHFCPVCLHVYRNDETDSAMVCCDYCDRWIHSECDNISDALYSTLSKEQSTYRCILCRGGKPERMDNFHKKYRSGTAVARAKK